MTEPRCGHRLRYSVSYREPRQVLFQALLFKRREKGRTFKILAASSTRGEAGCFGVRPVGREEGLGVTDHRVAGATEDRGATEKRLEETTGIADAARAAGATEAAVVTSFEKCIMV